ncbi:hypothetical protein KJ966_30670 [bacterium]|nr:hypothetical protein [bacterium]
MNSIKPHLLKGIGTILTGNFNSSAVLSAIVTTLLLITLAPLLMAGTCPTYQLKTGEGAIINPITGNNSDQPYSTRQTCGECHDYDQISNGYHFQMGHGDIEDNYSKTKPWALSPGMTGKFCIFSYRQLAKKTNFHPDEIDLTSFQFISDQEVDQSQVETSCAECHPGGGLLEFDRKGNRYDLYLAANPSLANQPDGDYFKSQWDRTGVIEVDCFFCHLSGYNKEKRNTQLSLLNFKWASVAASGIGQVYGSVRMGENPKVEYNRRLFNNDGSVALALEHRPTSENCLLCHKSIDMAKRGTLWDDKQNADVHKIAGMTCVDCHFSNLDHNLAKGDENISSVRDDLDNTMMSCEECHTLGHMGAPLPKHIGIRGDHLNSIDCTTCHIPTTPRSAAATIVMTNGDIIRYPRPTASNIGQQGKWLPGYERNQSRDKENNRIRPVNYVLPVLFTNQDEDGIHYPLFPKEIRNVYDKFKNKLEGNSNNPLRTKPDEITWMLANLSRALADNKRFETINLFYHKEGLVYSLDTNNELETEVDMSWVGKTEGYSISHNVAPARYALGSGGCDDCHTANSAIFTDIHSKETVGLEGIPVQSKSHLGYSPTIEFSNLIFKFHLNVLTPYLSAGLLTLILLLLLHLTLLQPKITDFLQEPAEFKLFNKAEHWSYLLKMIIFLFLVAFGHVVYFTKLGMLSVFISLYQKTLVFAGIVGIIVLIASVIALIIWIKGGYSGPYDKEWITKLRGSLENSLERKAKGRLSLSQKVLFWLMNTLAVFTVSSGLMLVFKGHFPVAFVLVLSAFHGFMAILFIAVILTRAYIIGIINPSQVWRSLVNTKISHDWATKHHSEWHNSIK